MGRQIWVRSLHAEASSAENRVAVQRSTAPSAERRTRRIELCADHMHARVRLEDMPASQNQELLPLARLLKHYAALSPASPISIPSPPFLAATDLSKPMTQQWLVQHLLPLDQTQQDGARGWKKAFWRRIVNGIEAGFDERRTRGDGAVEDEVRAEFPRAAYCCRLCFRLTQVVSLPRVGQETHPDLLEVMVEYLSSSQGGVAPGVSRRVYYYGPINTPVETWSSITTQEEGRLISGGASAFCCPPPCCPSRTPCI